MKFSIFQLSRRGGRAVNEDRMGYCYTREAALFLLADGMGGHAEGEVAAQLVLQSIAAQFQREAQPALKDPSEFLSRAVMTAHQRIQRYAKLQRMPDSPRTTVVVAVIQQGQVTWLHCGDSRLYWVRDGQLLARTRDHSYMEMERSAVTPIRLAHKLLNRNVLFTCLGAAGKPIFDLSGPHVLHSGDRLLLCSDGLWGVLKEPALLHGLSVQPVNEAIPALVESALQIAGEKSDNVTALALEWEMSAPASSEYDISTHSASLSELFASTIQSSHDLETLDDPLDEEEIERNIAEINAAIRRTAASKT
ncbi:MAG TPA: PP2C family serine/threonine-protein phosphatase [Comamonas sp.]